MRESDRYSPLLREDEKDERPDDRASRPARTTTTTTTTTKLLVLSNITLLLVSCALSIALLWPKWHVPRNADLKRVSFYSPLLDDLDIPVDLVQHDDTLYSHSKYARYPSSELDRDWNDLSNPRLVLVDDEAIRRIGKDPEYTVQHPRKPGKHVAMLGVNHQLHCLNSLRKNLFPEYYYPNGSSSPLHMDHLYHCVDLLRQTLMCNANLDLITFNWWELVDIPTPDFTVDMKCRRYESLQAWMDAPMEESGFFRWDEEGWIDGWRRQGGEKNVSAPRQWWDQLLEDGFVSPEEMKARWGDSWTPSSPSSQLL